MELLQKACVISASRFTGSRYAGKAGIHNKINKKSSP